MELLVINPYNIREIRQKVKGAIQRIAPLGVGRYGVGILSADFLVGSSSWIGPGSSSLSGYILNLLEN